MDVQQKQLFSQKNDVLILKLFLTVTAKKSFMFISRFKKKQNKTKNKQKIILRFYNFQGGWEKLHR